MAKEVGQMWLRVLILAACYWITGRLGLILAIPPGFATAVCPASGIALAGLLLFGNRLWLGIVLGSFLINVSTTFDASSASTLAASLGLPLGIGIGAALQALAGAWLVRRFVGFPDPLNREQAVARFLLLAGPVSCLIAATIGTSLLRATDRIHPGAALYTWCVWWVGDSIGAFVVAPLVILWLARTQIDWPRRPLTVTVPLALLAALVLSLFIFTDQRERDRMQDEFGLETKTLTQALKNQLEHAVMVLNAARADHGKVPSQAERADFRKAAQNILSRRAPVQALSWAPRVSSTERSSFEEAARRIHPGYAIRERSEEGGAMVAAPTRSSYFPILYREPAPELRQVFGFDIASESDRLSALHQAASSGESIATAPLSSTLLANRAKHILVILPIYQNGLLPASSAGRREQLVGFVVAVLRTDQLFELAWEGFKQEGIDFRFTDVTDPAKPREAYSRGRVRPRGVEDPEEDDAGASHLEQTSTIEMAGRRWMLQFVQTPQYVAANRSVQAWTVLSGGMLFTGLLGAVLLIVTGREAVVSGLVKERTAELAQSNATLLQEVHDRQQTENKFRGLLESAPDAIVIVHKDGTVALVNRQTEDLFGYPREELLGQPIEKLIPERFRDEHRRRRAGYFTHPAARPLDVTLNLFGLSKNGAEFPVEISLSPLATAEGVLLTSAIRDISLRRQAEAALEESRRLTGRIAEVLPNILYVYDVKTQQNIFVNGRIQSMLGYSAEESQRSIAALYAKYVHPDDRARLEWGDDQLLQGDDGAVVETEFRIRHANGEWRWLQSRVTAFSRDGDGLPTQILGTARDVTERKRLEQEVLDVAAQEQHRIGQELHDSTGQALTGLCMLADNLADMLRGSAPGEAPLAQRVAHGLRQALGEVRTLSRGLVPVEVDAEGLMAALTDLTNRISEMHAIRCTFECAQPVPVEDNFVATQLYRIAQEAITNSLKHGRAASIRVSLDSKDGFLTLRIADDGVGLPAEPPEERGMGLRIMNHRASQIGGHLAVRAAPTRGTIITCTYYLGGSND